MLFRPADYIIEILVPKKSIGAQFIYLAGISENLLFIPVVLGILEGNLLPAVDSFVYNVYVIEVLRVK